MIREVLARRGLDWGNALVLGAAFGVFQEALVVQTWYNFFAKSSPSQFGLTTVFFLLGFALPATKIPPPLNHGHLCRHLQLRPLEHLRQLTWCQYTVMNERSA